ncbi:DNA mismatch repair protein MutL [Clostridia bacterium]|nr:DNA mismatch repair protein MutL [Clostridia bacterium]
MINVLDHYLANLIAAGEVVDRPSSALKELVENAVDSGATSVTVEIKGGGISYMRVTDNGCGMSGEDLSRSILRHATSKIKSENDLTAIKTLGFRGEALAAIAAVTELEIYTKERTSPTGYLLESISGSESAREVKINEAGCPDGTTVIAKRFFFEVPARLKFLKRDLTEAMYCKSVVEKAALANPGISYRFINEGAEKLFTPGTGNLRDAVYSVWGRDKSANLIEIASGGDNAIGVSGFVSRIEDMRKTRADELFFINSRAVRSQQLYSAVEEAYRSVSSASRFPGCVLNITINHSLVDVNVHPQKTEVRFSDERSVFSAVYYAVKNALSARLAVFTDGEDRIPPSEEYYIPEPQTHSEQSVESQNPPAAERESGSDLTQNHTVPTTDSYSPHYPQSAEGRDSTFRTKIYDSRRHSPEENKLLLGILDKAVTLPVESEVKDYRIVGEVFLGYIIVEYGEKILLIDKHASHERIIYDIIFQSVKNAANDSRKTQILLAPVIVKLNTASMLSALELHDKFAEIGFIYSSDTITEEISVSELPAELPEADYVKVLTEIFESYAEGQIGEDNLTENLALMLAKKSAACRAAMKAGIRDGDFDIAWLVDRVIRGGGVNYCPHGRPVAVEIKKYALEKMFLR